MNELTAITKLLTPEQNETASIVWDSLAPNTRRAYETNLKAVAA
ncbi:MAG: hypothetical protein OXE41_07290 [Gammaproteobacteria bacterium]|nr:hypothetical protein [Gammaproteobacteria bacterium]MCY4219429.1 hypothetical protein [Gammaproteobacteria bacterium]MCY4275179.1 hypothetical protein [Gammaproteobacteria bacterium]